MLINEIQSKVGLTKKSIRYYEDVGLIDPGRDHKNGYRTYTEEDVKELKKIKFLRGLDISIQDLQELKMGKLSLESCMQKTIQKVEEYEKNYQKISLMCKEIINSKESFQEFDETKYLQKLNIMKKKGFVMGDIQKDHSKKIRGAFISSAIFIIFFLLIMGLVTYFQFTEEEKMPWMVYIVFMGMFSLPMVSVIINLVSRIKEIKGGEEDEASKY